MIQTPSTKAVITVEQFDADYLLQFKDSQGRVLCTLGERAGPGAYYEGFFLWDGDALDENDEERSDYLQTFPKLQVCEELGQIWKEAVKAAYTHAVNKLLASL